MPQTDTVPRSVLIPARDDGRICAARVGSVAGADEIAALADRLAEATP